MSEFQVTRLILALVLSQNGVSVTNRTVEKAVSVRCVTPDGGGFESCGGSTTVNNSGGTSTQGVGIDGGQAWNVSGQVAVTNFPSSQAVTGTFWPGTQPVSGTLGATQGAGEDGGRAWNVGGTVAVSNFPATQAVSVASLPTTAVTGPLTDTQLRASAVPVSVATVPAHAVTQSTGEDGGRAWNVAGAVAVTNFPATQAVTLASAPTTAVTGTFWQSTQPVSGPVTDTQLRATPVPVSGTVTASGPVTDTQLRASAVPVSLASMPSTPVTGTFFQASQPVVATQGPSADGGTDWATRVSRVDSVVYVYSVAPPLNPFMPRCNAVRRLNCQP